jgi:aminoglycoside phosphotransferase (APT) family kinase protein
MSQAITLLPTTMVNGDVHGGNVIANASPPVLFDWGEALVAPPMLDVVRSTLRGSSKYLAYIDAASSAGMSESQLSGVEIGYDWAVVYHTAQKLWAFANSTDAEWIQMVVDRGSEALRRLGSGLSDVAAT